MKLFLSRFNNKLDKNSRVSVPVNYRNLLSEDGFNGVIAYPSIKHKAIEVCSAKKLESIIELIKHLDIYSDARDAFETIIMGSAVQLPFDRDGRVILTKELIEYAELSDEATFVGKGDVFEIWNPKNFNKYFEYAKSIANENRSMLKSS